MSIIRKHMATSTASGMRSATRERERAVAEIKAQTAQALRNFETERLAMARALQIECAADRLNRSAEVLEIRENASALSQGFRQEHGQMRRALRQTLVESRQGVASAVAALFHEFGTDRVDFARTLRRKAEAQGASLAQDRWERSRKVSQMMLSFAKAHHQMAKAQWTSLAQCRRDRSRSLAELMKRDHGTRADMAVKNLPRALPAAPVARLTTDLFKPAAPSAFVQAAPQTTLATPAKQWPSTPPRGEGVKPVLAQAPIKVVAVKAPLPKTKAKPAKAKRK